MQIKPILKKGVFVLLACVVFSQASAQQVTVSITSGGNSNSAGEFKAWCLDSGKSCKVTGNRTHHAGPRSCSMTCEIDELAIFSCEANNVDRWVDDVYVPNSATLISMSSNRTAYGWVVSESASVSCSYTD
ncbi:hypothetical protein FKG94_06685 [Exilibacterium tricleocarpae]|uniref:Uncharacterized protein n=1 Tax=Exilibacterium tricleocarpae TaxID=2591008 RepID=A0A545TYY3_9GAMM|nr:hypothetical protein [Exilibacterium tricleocarpae]TQV82426.1 hypothetical protein FKG94_06685 [Exilibacterium tricleocarpae]